MTNKYNLYYVLSLGCNFNILSMSINSSSFILANLYKESNFYQRENIINS